MTNPAYWQLLSELVGTLESLEFYVRDESIKEQARKRAAELRSLSLVEKEPSGMRAGTENKWLYHPKYGVIPEKSKLNKQS